MCGIRITEANTKHMHRENTCFSFLQVCSESSASESSLESSSGYGSQGAFAAEDQAHAQQLAHAEGNRILNFIYIFLLFINA